jgi:methionine salvage enolase-phosphatase E1
MRTARPRLYLLWLMDRDRKSTALKSLQGKTWKAGFESGKLKGTLFDDVPDAFARWSAPGKIAIYSAGPVEAQRLVVREGNAPIEDAHGHVCTSSFDGI